MMPSTELVSASDVPLSHPVTTFLTASAAVKLLEIFGILTELTSCERCRGCSEAAWDVQAPLLEGGGHAGKRGLALGADEGAAEGAAISLRSVQTQVT
jgi:hypothetical protein